MALGRRDLVLVGVVALAAGALGGWLGSRHGPGPPPTTQAAAAPAVVSVTAPPVADSSGQAIARAAKRVNPAVVNIDNLARPGAADPFADVLRPPGGGQPVVRGSGSGFVIDAAQGWILTNQHVVEDAERLTVTLGDGRTLEAQLLGADQLTDVAVLRVPADRLPAAPLGRQAKLEPGEWVIAIGNPFREFPHTVTVGVISALNRNRQLPGRDYSNLIQTDAAINMGNSGGPLCNLRGEVIGVNSAIASPTGTFAGVGFAIVIDDALAIAQHLIQHGGVPQLAIAMRDLDAATAQRLRATAGQGVVVDRVMPNGPAAKAGLLQDDVILQVNGQPLREAGALQQAVLQAAPGDALTLTIRRDGRERRLKVTLGVRRPQ